MNNFEYDFFDPRARFWARVLFASIGLIVWSCILINPCAQPVDYSADANDIKAESTEVRLSTPPQPTAVSPTNNLRAELVELGVQSEPEPNEPVPEIPNLERPQAPSSSPLSSQQHARNPDRRLERQLEITVGVTAPHYVLATKQLYAELAQRHLCRYLITDGRIPIEIGRKLSTASRLRCFEQQLRDRSSVNDSARSSDENHAELVVQLARAKALKPEMSEILEQTDVTARSVLSSSDVITPATVPKSTSNQKLTRNSSRTHDSFPGTHNDADSQTDSEVVPSASTLRVGLQFAFVLDCGCMGRIYLHEDGKFCLHHHRAGEMTTHTIPIVSYPPPPGFARIAILPDERTQLLCHPGQGIAIVIQ